MTSATAVALAMVVVSVSSAAARSVDPSASLGAKTTPTTSAPSTTTSTTTTTIPKPLPRPGGGAISWQPYGGRTALGQPLMYSGSSGGAFLVWFPPGLVRPVIVPGTGDPLASPWGGQVETGSRSLLVAAFNGGFKWSDFTGGVLAFGQTYRTMIDGQASFVVFADGSFTVARWGRDVSASTPNVVAVRQNLEMLVDGSAPTAAASTADWGASVQGIGTTRSGLGVDANGGLIWASGAMTPVTLANTLIGAGAVRGMQMDINPDWVNFNTYASGADGKVHGTAVVGGFGSDKFLSPNGRDFVAILVRGAVVPGDSGMSGQPPVPVALRLRAKH